MFIFNLLKLQNEIIMINFIDYEKEEMLINKLYVKTRLILLFCFIN